MKIELNDLKNLDIIYKINYYQECSNSAEELCRKLQDFNFKNGGGAYEKKEILIKAFDDDLFIGGILGVIKYKWLYLDILFVEENYRKKGIGSNLVRQIEEIAIKEDVKHFHLNTASFQVGPRFYEKLGYQIFAKRNVFASDGKIHLDYFMKKEL